jgi:hypothetical protein
MNALIEIAGKPALKKRGVAVFACGGSPAVPLGLEVLAHVCLLLRG